MVPETVLAEAVRTGLNVAFIGEAGAGKERAARLLHAYKKYDDFQKYDFQNGVSELWSLAAKFVNDFNLWLAESLKPKKVNFLRNIHALDHKQINYIIEYLQSLLNGKEIPPKEFLSAGLICSCEPRAAIASPWKELIVQFFPIEINIPPLRQRKIELPQLVSEILKEYQLATNKSVAGIQPAAMEILHDHHWPGNISELKSVLGQACALTDDRKLISRDIIAKRIKVSGSVSTVK